MRKLLLFFIIFLANKNIIAQNIKQTDWQWRNNTSTESIPNNKANINTPVTSITPNYNLRLRIKVEEQDPNTGTGTGSVISVIDHLRYTSTPENDLTWVDVGTVDNGTVPFIIQSTNNVVAQDDRTTNQLGGIASNFYSGIYMVTNPNTDGVNFYVSTFTEIEWCVKVCTNAQPGTKYYFKEYGSTNSCNAVGVGSGLPALTTIGVLPVKLTSFNLISNAKEIILKWATASEENNDRFEILRSGDSKNWKTITTVKGQGTTSLSTNYSTIDESPLYDINYYKIKQLNNNGSFSFSEIKAIKSSANKKSFLSISPNPAHVSIDFSTTHNISNVEVSLANINGSIIYKEKIINLTSGSVNKLKLQKLPAPGLYILTLRGVDLFETNKLIIN